MDQRVTNDESRTKTKVTLDDFFDNISRTAKSGDFFEEIFRGQYPKTIKEAIKRVEWYFNGGTNFDDLAHTGKTFDVVFVPQELFTAEIYIAEINQTINKAKYYGTGEPYRILIDTQNRVERFQGNIRELLNDGVSNWKDSPCYALIFMAKYPGGEKEFWGAAETTPLKIINMIGVL